MGQAILCNSQPHSPISLSIQSQLELGPLSIIKVKLIRYFQQFNSNLFCQMGSSDSLSRVIFKILKLFFFFCKVNFQLLDENYIGLWMILSVNMIISIFLLIDENNSLPLPLHEGTIIVLIFLRIKYRTFMIILLFPNHFFLIILFSIISFFISKYSNYLPNILLYFLFLIICFYYNNILTIVSQ